MYLRNLSRFKDSIGYAAEGSANVDCNDEGAGWARVRLAGISSWPWGRHEGIDGRERKTEEAKRGKQRERNVFIVYLLPLHK